MERRTGSIARAWFGVLAGSLLWAAGAATADDFAGRITAATGTVEAGGSGQPGEGVADGEHVSLGDDGGCSILVDDDAVVELCGDTTLSLRKEKDRRIVELDRGEIRLVVEPRLLDRRVEIHTPAAVATLLGTIVHVSVDERTGVTTISSAQSRVSVRSGDGAIRGTTVIDTSEQVTVVPGQAPPARPVRLERAQLAALGGCLVDFHSAAVGSAADEHHRRLLERLALVDADFADFSTVASEAGAGLLERDDPIATQEGVCETIDCAAQPMDEIGSIESFDDSTQPPIEILEQVPRPNPDTGLLP